MREITILEFLMSRVTEDKLTPEQLSNMNILLPKANALLAKFGEFRKCNSGFRTLEDQQRINPGAIHSKHLLGAAIDLEDADGKLKQFIINNPDILVELDLYQEAPESTKTWVHIQCIAPKSGHHVFIP